MRGLEAVGVKFGYTSKYICGRRLYTLGEANKTQVGIGQVSANTGIVSSA